MAGSGDSRPAPEPDSAALLNESANRLAAAMRYEEALKSYELALRIEPKNAAVLSNRGAALARLEHHAAALASFAAALEIDPDNPMMLNSRGSLLLRLGRVDKALADFDRALAVRPESAPALFNRGLALLKMARPDEALRCFERVLTLVPDHSYALGALADCAMRLCDWDRTAALAAELRAHITKRKSTIPPFVALAYFDEPALHRQCAETLSGAQLPDPLPPLRGSEGRRHDRIRLAYLSTDFRRHAVGYLTAGLFEQHDRRNFEVFGISLGPDDGSELRARIVRAFDRFEDVRQTSDRAAAELLRNLEIDIAVDLNGHTTGARPGILARRPAPVQVSYLGYPGTTGAGFIDYVIADAVVLPFDQQQFYAEQIVHLPGSYQVNDRKRPIGAVTPARAELGLPDDGFVFCCFHDSYKITAPMFERWMRLLQSLAGSVLWLRHENDGAETNLRRAAAARGVDPARLVFAGSVGFEEHMARQRAADLFLDTLPYNAHTTASDALWAGLPVLTCRGQAFAGRVAASLLAAAGVPELATGSLDEYEALALRLATEPELLAGLRRRLADNRDGCALFDTGRFCRRLEAAYNRMWEGWQRGAAPQSFAVAAPKDAAPAAAVADGNSAAGLENLGRQTMDSDSDDRCGTAGAAEAAEAAPHPALVEAARLHEDGRLAEAEPLYRAALRDDPEDFDALHLLGVLLHQEARNEEALALIDAAIALEPDILEARSNHAAVLEALGRLEEALASCAAALAIEPGHAAVMANRAALLDKLGRDEEALAAYGEVLVLQPDHLAAHRGRGAVLARLGRHEAALAEYEAALAIAADDPAALYGGGSALWVLRRYDAALARFEKLRKLVPDHPHVLGAIADCALKLCDWDRTKTLAGELRADVIGQKSVIEPFTLLGYVGDPLLHLQCARAFVRAKVRAAPPALRKPGPRRGDRIRLAYVSADFRRHPMASLTAGLYELHDRGRFEVFGISLGPDDGSELRARLVAGFDHFHDAQRLDDTAAAQLLADLEIDIAIDLNGHTERARPGIFARRPAPVQAALPGYPGSLGAPFIDYVIADPTVLPFDDQPFYSEKIVHLPDSYQVNDGRRDEAGAAPARSRLGLPEDGFVFCSFNNSYKISAAVFERWMRLLRKVENSVLWLLADNDGAARNLRQAAAAHGIEPDRLVFAPRLGAEEHLARQRAADLFLDTLPYNAHTTASDALWAGLPVLTCRGQTFAGRVAASVLTAAGLPELVTDDLDAYEALALRLATERPLLEGLRRRLADTRDSCALFDTGRFCRHIEAAFLQMWELHRAGEGPRSFAVEAIGGPSAAAIGLAPLPAELAAPGPEDYFRRALNLRLTGDLEGSAANYRKLLALAPGSAETWNALGVVLLWLGRFDEASDCFRRAAALKPDLADAYQNLATCQQLAVDGAELERTAALMDNPELPVEARSSAGFALGKALDAAGRYDEAFAAYRRANEMYRASRIEAGDWFDAAALRRQVDWLTATFTPEFFAAVASSGNPSEVPVFIVGMPRSGTSLIEQIGASHSQVYGAGELQEISRVPGEIGWGTAGAAPRWQEDALARAAARHLEWLRELGGEALRVIDKMPDNILYLGLIATLFPAARIVFTRRDARDVALSCYFQRFNPGMLSFAYDLGDCGRRQIEIDRLKAHWLKVLPVRMLEIEYEKLVADLEGESRRFVDFLGLEWEPACLEFHRTERAVETASTWQVKQPIYDRSVGRWRNYERHLAPLLAALSGADPDDSATQALHEAVATGLAAANEHYQAGDFDRAEGCYREVLDRTPRNPDALHGLGVIAGARGDLDEAERLIREAIAISPYDPAAHYDLGNALRELGKAGDAEAAFRTALSMRPDHRPTLGNLAALLAADNRPQEALVYFSKLAELEPGVAVTHFDIAGCRRRTGDVAGSLESLRRVVALDPEYQSGWNDLGVTHAMLEEWAEAEKCFRRVLEIEPGSPRARQQLAHVLQQRRLGVARPLGSFGS